VSTSRPLLIAAHVPPPLRPPLRTAIGEHHRIAEAADWADLADIVKRRPVDLVVADPAADGSVNVSAVATMLERFPRTPVLVYTVLGPSAVTAMADLSRRGLRDVVLHRYDDSPKRFHQVLERVARKQLSQYVVANISDALGLLPDSIARAIEQAFDRPQAFSTIADIASAAGVPLSKLYRSLQATGFQSPRRILVAARVLRAHAYMREPGYTVRDVAQKLGYSHPRILARHTHLALGVKPRHLRRRMSDDAVVGRLVDWMYATDAAD
jgi:AraC-like DNA-binding protein